MRDFELMERDQQGYATTNGLFAIVSTLGRMPGRKSLVLFSEGSRFRHAVQRLFLGVIDAANRANVSIYTMDAAGLRAESDQAKIRDAVNQAAGVGINTAYSGDGGGGALTNALENNEDVLAPGSPHRPRRARARAPAACSSTTPTTCARRFERVESDLRNYYLLGYTPPTTPTTAVSARSRSR